MCQSSESKTLQVAALTGLNLGKVGKMETGEDELVIDSIVAVPSTFWAEFTGRLSRSSSALPA